MISRNLVDVVRTFWGVLDHKSVLYVIFHVHFYLIGHPAMDSGKRGMNPIAMTIINAEKKYWLSRGSNQRPPVLKSAMLRTELWGSASQELKTKC